MLEMLGLTDGFLCSFSLLFCAVLCIRLCRIGAADARLFLKDRGATFGSVDTRSYALQAVGYVLSQRNFDLITSYSAASVYFSFIPRFWEHTAPPRVLANKRGGLIHGT